MAREAIIEIDFSGYSARVFDVIKLLSSLGWNFYDTEKRISCLPLGDEDAFDWQKSFLEVNDFETLIDKKQRLSEQIGVVLYYENSERGITFLCNNTKEIFFLLNINRKTLGVTSDAITDFTWYFDNIIQKISKTDCQLLSWNFEEYMD